VREGKSYGTIIVPTGLDQATASLLAATIESIERVGPFKCKIKLSAFEDIREERKKKIIKRAKEILSEITAEEWSGSLEALKEITEVKKREIVSYGEEKIPAGTDVEKSREIILVEGRADVNVLLKAGYGNVISIEGGNIPKSVVELTKRKDKVTVLLDGDTAGDKLLKTVLERCKVDYIARAPKGKEVEELTPSEVRRILRNKEEVERVISKLHIPKLSKEEREKALTIAENIYGKLKAVFLDGKWKIIGETPIVDMMKELDKTPETKIIIMDGVITQRVLDKAYSKGIRRIIGQRIGEIEKKPGDIEILTTEELKEDT